MNETEMEDDTTSSNNTKNEPNMTENTIDQLKSIHLKEVIDLKVKKSKTLSYFQFNIHLKISSNNF
jgi:hypothetical protein